MKNQNGKLLNKIQSLRQTATRYILSLDTIPAWKICIYLAYVCIVIYMLTRSLVIGGDSPGIAYLPASILRHGTLRLDPYINGDFLFDLSRNPHYVVASNGHYYSKFSPLPSILALPLYGLFFLLVGLPDETTGSIIASYITLSKLSASVIATSVIIVVFLILKRVLKQRYALLIALVYAFGVHTWTTATKTLATQSTGELFLALGLLNLLKAEERRHTSPTLSRKHILLTGFCISVAVVARPQLILVAFIIGVYILKRNMRNRVSWIFYGVGAIPAIILLGLYNFWAFGSPFSTGYGGEALQGWTTPIWVGLPGILVSPTHGLLVYSPVFLFAVVGGIAVWSLPDKAVNGHENIKYLVLLGRYLAVCVLVQLLLMSHWWAWYGGVAYNQRMLQEVHSFMIFLAALGLYIYKDKVWIIRLFTIAVFWGIFMNLSRTAFYSKHLDWVESYHPLLIWSLRYSEIPMYIKWHGLLGFAKGIGKVLLQVVPISFLSSAILSRLLLPKQKVQD